MLSYDTHILHVTLCLQLTASGMNGVQGNAPNHVALVK